VRVLVELLLEMSILQAIKEPKKVDDPFTEWEKI
jgi:hypothetical protein